MNKEADLVLQDYFRTNRGQVQKWMNIITPSKVSITDLKAQITKLSSKRWSL